MSPEFVSFSVVKVRPSRACSDVFISFWLLPFAWPTHAGKTLKAAMLSPGLAQKIGQMAFNGDPGSDTDVEQSNSPIIPLPHTHLAQ